MRVTQLKQKKQLWYFNMHFRFSKQITRRLFQESMAENYPIEKVEMKPSEFGGRALDKVDIGIG